MRSLASKVQEVPETILPDGAANPAGVIPQLQQAAGCAETRGLQLRRVVVADHTLTDAGEVHRSSDAVAAGLGNDAQDRTGDFSFAEAGGDREGDLLRVGDVRVVAGHTATVACRADAQPVDLQPSLVAIAPAGGAEHHHARRRLDIRR